MSDTAYWITLVAALALASYSLRLLIYGAPAERPKRAALLAASSLLGILLAAWAVAWSAWPAGLVAGLAVVELGGVVLRRLRREVASSPAPRGDSDTSPRARGDGA